MTAESKLKLIEKVINAAFEYGAQDKDLVGVVGAIAAIVDFKDEGDENAP